MVSSWGPGVWRAESKLRRVRTPLAIIAVLLAILVPIGFATDKGAGPPQRAAAPVVTIAARVETMPGLRFRERPVPLHVSPAQVQREGLADLVRGYSAARRHADEAL